MATVLDPQVYIIIEKGGDEVRGRDENPYIGRDLTGFRNLSGLRPSILFRQPLCPRHPAKPVRGGVESLPIAGGDFAR